MICVRAIIYAKLIFLSACALMPADTIKDTQYGMSTPGIADMFLTTADELFGNSAKGLDRQPFFTDTDITTCQREPCWPALSCS